MFILRVVNLRGIFISDTRLQQISFKTSMPNIIFIPFLSRQRNTNNKLNFGFTI